MIKLNKFKLIRWLITLIISALFIYYLYNHHSQLFGSLKNIKPQYLLLVLLGQLIGQYSNSAIFRDTLKPLNINMPRFEAFKVVVVSSFINFITPVVGGASTRAVYMKAKYGLPYTALISTLYAYYSIMFSVSFAFGLAGIYLIPQAVKSPTGTALTIFFAAGLIGGALFVFFGHRAVRVIRKVPIKNRLLLSVIAKLVLIDEGWGSIRREKNLIFKMAFWSLIANGGLVLIYWAAITSLGIKTHIGAYMIFAAFASVNLLLNLTPGNVGIRESLYASIYKITGIGLQRVIAFSLIDRAGQIVIIGLGWLLFGQSIVKQASQRPSSK